MKKAYIRRLDSSDQGAFGRLYLDDNEAFYTMELPNRENKANLSCIPTGIYKASRVYVQKFGKRAYLLENVPNRFGILIHSANFAGDTSLGYKSQLYGCIALGEKIGTMDGQKCLLLSRPAIRRFEQLTKGEELLLEIQ